MFTTRTCSRPGQSKYFVEEEVYDDVTSMSFEGEGEEEHAAILRSPIGRFFRESGEFFDFWGS